MAGRTIVRSFVRTSGPLTYQLPLKGFAMNISQLLLRGSFASLAAILLVLPQRAFADTYQFTISAAVRVLCTALPIKAELLCSIKRAVAMSLITRVTAFWVPVCRCILASLLLL
jgi:hypothetical protein